MRLALSPASEDWIKSGRWDMPDTWDAFVAWRDPTGIDWPIFDTLGWAAWEAAPPDVAEGLAAFLVERGYPHAIPARLGANYVEARVASGEARTAEWDESLHPRGEGGRFGEKGDAEEGLPPAEKPVPNDWKTIGEVQEREKAEGLLDQKPIPPLASDRMIAENRAASEAWKHDVTTAIATGQVPIDVARERWGREVDYLAQNMGASPDRNWEPLPSELWHVTTAASAVEASGQLMTRDELDMDRARGLGGGRSDTISFTTDPVMAVQIRDSMLEARSVAAGDITAADMMERARTGEDAARPYEKDVVGYWDREWQPGQPYPEGLQKLIDDPKYATPDDRLDLYKNVSMMREGAGGPPDPLFFGTDAEALARVDPADIAIVKASPVEGAMGVQMTALGEWRVPTGKAVTIEKIAATAALLASWDEELHPRGEGGRFTTSDTLFGQDVREETDRIQGALPGARVEWLGPIDKALAAEVAASVERFASDYPMAARSIAWIGTAPFTDDSAIASTLSSRPIAELPSGDALPLSADRFDVALNSSFYGDPEKFTAVMERLHESRFHPLPTTQSAVDHELGHVLARQSTGVQRETVDSLTSGVRTEISGYAASSGSPHEAFAEAFSTRGTPAWDEQPQAARDAVERQGNMVQRMGQP